MGNGSKRSRSDEYVFVNGVAVRSDEVVRLDVSDVAVPGQAEALRAPLPSEQTSQGVVSEKQVQRRKRLRGADKASAGKDASQSTEMVQSEGVAQSEGSLMFERRRILCRKYGVFGGILVVLVLFSLCLSTTQPGLVRNPGEVVACIGEWFKLAYLQIASPAAYTQEYNNALVNLPAYGDVMLQVWMVFKYVACGALLALSGALYQNTFRNPIAAPSMLGVTSGMNVALLVLVLQYGYAAVHEGELYCIYSFTGGAVVLILVMLGGKFISGKGQFNVVNMILMGTIVSQLLGVVVTYAQTVYMDEQTWEAYYMLQNALGEQSVWMAVSLVVGGIVALVPVVLFRFQLNLVSFSDEETRLLGVNPNKLRLVAFACGSIMILVAQMNAGQVAMASLVVPFAARAVFGSEFRGQLGGCMVLGAIVLLICGDLSTAILIDGTAIGLGTTVTLFALPLFVWMLAVRQRSWE